MEGPKQTQSTTHQSGSLNQPQSHSQSEKPPSEQPQKSIKQLYKYKILQQLQKYFTTAISSKLSQSIFNTFSIIEPNDPDRIRYTEILTNIFEKIQSSRQNMKKCKISKQSQNKEEEDQVESENIESSEMEDVQEDKKQIFESVYKRQMLGEEINVKIQRGIACFLGLAICDALGASTQFIHFEKKRRHLIAYDFDDVISQIKRRVLDTRSGKVGIWTDDCSMALCMADSLLLNNYKFDPKHMRYMFHMWLEHGLNNGGRKFSIGLGGNIAISMSQFTKKREDYTAEKDKFNNGNGSLMRLAPVPLCFLDNENQGMQFSQKSSRTTHNGDQAKQCAKLLALILIRLINRPEQQNWKQVIETACKDFTQTIKTIPTVQHLANSQQQSLQLFQKQAEEYGNKFLKFNKSIQDRNWNWKDPQFTYSKCRTNDQPGYIGSYCMDALSMALHTIWYTSSFQDVALVNANMGGDCDTVGAIAGQIAGAIYGIDDYMLHLYSQMDDGKLRRFQVFLKAYKLITHRPI